MQKQNTPPSLPYCPRISKSSTVRCVGDTWGKPRCNFSPRYLALFDKGRTIRKAMVGRGGWGRNKGKMSPPKNSCKWQARVSDAASTLEAGGKIWWVAAHDSRARFHMYTGYKYPENWKRSWKVKMPSLKLQNTCILAINYALIMLQFSSIIYLTLNNRRLSSMPKKPQPLICEAILVFLIIFAW